MCQNINVRATDTIEEAGPVFDEAEFVDAALGNLVEERELKFLFRLGLVLLGIALGLAMTSLLPTFLTDQEFASRQDLLREQVDGAALEWETGQRLAFDDESPAGTLSIPRLGLNEVFGAGVTLEDLRSGVGWASTSALSGEGQNIALAGHRNGWGGPFRNVDALEEGDTLSLSWSTGAQAEYSVISSEIVDPNAIEHIHADPKGDRETLTIITCDPPGSIENRLIVTAQLTNLSNTDAHSELLRTSHSDRVENVSDEAITLPELNNPTEERPGTSIPTSALVGLAVAFISSAVILLGNRKPALVAFPVQLTGFAIAAFGWASSL